MDALKLEKAFNEAINRHNQQIEFINYNDNLIEKLEAYLPYLREIILRPNNNLKNEEEIIPIEKSKRISKNSITHLAKHSNYIRVVDSEIRPVKILNQYKDETNITYENRFIYTLLLKIKELIKLNTGRILKLMGSIAIENEEYNYSIRLELNMHDKIKKINNELNRLFDSDLIKELRNSELVRAPILKTNLLIKNPNYKKALELYNYLIEENNRLLDNSLIGNANSFIKDGYFLIKDNKIIKNNSLKLELKDKEILSLIRRGIKRNLEIQKSLKK